MKHASLFSGIGGPEVAAAVLGWENAFHCEINPFGRKVLDYWFPDSESYEDITKTDFRKWRGRIDVLTGGFPCQPFSYAGKRRGRDDERYLWPEMLRAIDEIRPAWVVGENVAGLATMVEGGLLSDMGGQTSLFTEEDDVHGYEFEQTFTIERICKDLERIGYSVQPVLIPAAAVGAPHRRDRVFFLAYNAQDHDGLRREDDTSGIGRQYPQHRDARSGDSQRLRPEAGTDASHSGDAGPQGQRKRKAEVHSPESIAHSHGRGRGQVYKYLQSELTEGTEPFGACGVRSSADTDRTGLQEPQQPGREADSTQGGEGLHHRAVGPCEYVAASDAFRERLSAAVQSGCDGEEERDGKERSTMFASDDAWTQGTWWDNFPTVSPVHRGNDGLPFPLDDLTVPFARWRTESLKAYGNAIVPQVMYRIFQAIESVSNQ